MKSGEVHPPADNTHDGKGTLLIDGNKCRVFSKGQAWSIPSKSFQKTMSDSVFQDGKTISLNRFSPNPAPLGFIQKDQSNFYAKDVAQWPLRAAFRGADPNVMNRVDIGAFTLARRVTLSGVSMVEVVQEKNEIHGEAKMWVDPSQDFAARRYERYARDGKLQQRLLINTRKDASGVWVPNSWSVVVYKGTKLTRAVEVKVGELSINAAAQPDDFRLDFPVGTKVSDSTGPEIRDYIIRESDSREIPRQELGQKYSDLLRTEPGELVLGSKPSFWVRNRYMWWGLGCVGIGGFLLLARRLYRSRSNGEAPGFGPATTMEDGP
jgi:hypothetical protein